MQCGVHQKEQAKFTQRSCLGESAETILLFFSSYFHIHVSKSFHMSFTKSETPRYLLLLPFRYSVLLGLKNGPVMQFIPDVY